MIKLQLKAKHFKNATFTEPFECAIANAAMEYFNTKIASDGVHYLTVCNKTYAHDCYSERHFNLDLLKAMKRNFDESIIRTIELNEI